jgi:hypothetical protein
MHCAGRYMTSGGHDHDIEKSPNAGVLQTWGFPSIDFFNGIGGILDVFLMGEPISGSYEEAHIGVDLDMDCSGGGAFTVIASLENQNGRAGSAHVAGIYPYNRKRDNTEFLGPELGDTAWFGQGPSVVMAGHQYRIAVGYESILSNGVSQPKVRIYNDVAASDMM